MSDVECPYCGSAEEICHDDGYGYAEDCKHEQECNACGKRFVFATSILFLYEAGKADCLNGADHNYKPASTYPVEFTRMRCTACDDERQPTNDEMRAIIELRDCRVDNEPKSRPVDSGHIPHTIKPGGQR